MNFCPYCQLPLEAPVSQCPSCYADLASASNPPPAAPPGQGGGTIVESVEDVRDTINQIRSSGTVVEGSPQPPAPEKSASPPPSKPVDDGTVAFDRYVESPRSRFVF